MIHLVEPRDPNKANHPEPVAVLHHLTQVFTTECNGSPTTRQMKKGDDRHWYLFDRTGRAVAKFAPEIWAKAVAGI